MRGRGLGGHEYLKKAESYLILSAATVRPYRESVSGLLVNGGYTKVNYELRFLHFKVRC